MMSPAKIAKLSDALDLISKGLTRPTRIAKALGITYRTYANYMVRSNANDPEFLLTYQNQEMQFAKAVTLATRLALLELRGMALQETIYGVQEVQVFQGQVVWALDPEASAFDEDTREMLGLRRDGLLERDGKLVPFTVTKPAPWAQRQRLLEAAFADLRPTSTVTQNVNVNGQVGVAFAAKTDYTRGPPEIPPPPPMPELPAPVDAEFSEIDDPELEDILGGDLVSAAPVSVSIGVTIADPLPPVGGASAPPVGNTYSDAPTSRETAQPQEGLLKPPVAYDEAPRRAARSPLEQNLFDELDKAKARRDATR